MKKSNHTEFFLSQHYLLEKEPDDITVKDTIDFVFSIIWEEGFDRNDPEFELKTWKKDKAAFVEAKETIMVLADLIRNLCGAKPLKYSSESILKKLEEWSIVDTKRFRTERLITGNRLVIKPLIGPIDRPENPAKLVQVGQYYLAEKIDIAFGLTEDIWAFMGACPKCGNIFKKKTKRKEFCSLRCQEALKQERHRKKKK